MEMINRCLEITDAKRREIEEHDFERRHAERKAMIEERRERRGEGNRKERRRQAALDRRERV